MRIKIKKKTALRKAFKRYRHKDPSLSIMADGNWVLTGKPLDSGDIFETSYDNEPIDFDNAVYTHEGLLYLIYIDLLSADEATSEFFKRFESTENPEKFKDFKDHYMFS